MRVRLLLRLLGPCVLAGVLVASVLMPMAIGTGLVINRNSATTGNLLDRMITQDMPVATTLTDRGGKPIAYIYDQYRKPLPPDQIPQVVKGAITAAEDKRYWGHSAVDPQGVARALFSNAQAGKVTQGGSTLTQQYVKNFLVHVDAKTPLQQQQAQASTMARKINEARVATEVGAHMNKEEVLAAYLNVVPFGNQAYGIAAAAQTYFGKPAQQLTTAESALLAGLVNQPGNLDPATNPEEALARRNTVLDRMADPANNIRITKEDAERAKQEPLGVVHPLQRPPNKCIGAGDSQVSGFFCSYVEDYLAKAGINADQLETGGYTIRTTLDPEANRIAKEAAERNVPKDNPFIANALALIRPGRDSHQIVALAANRDFGPDASKGQTMYNEAASTVPFGGGSVYKVFNAASLMEQRKGGIFQMVDAPPDYTSSIFKNGTAPYHVGNAEGVKPGPRTLQMALATSPNTAFVKLEEKTGVANMVDMANRLGMRDQQDHTMSGNKADPGDPTIAQKVKETNNGAYTLGFTPTNVLQLSNVGATIMSDGRWCEPTPVLDAKDKNGNPVPLKHKPCEQAINPGLAHSLAVGMSKDDAPGGTSARAAQSVGWNRPLAAKTGTTENYQSAAFLGATPQLAGADLIYTDGRKTGPICKTNPPSLCGDGNMFGGDVPAHTWYQAASQILQGKPVLPLPPPDPRYQ